MFKIDEDDVPSLSGFLLSYTDNSGRQYYLSYYNGRYNHNWIEEKARAWIVPSSKIDSLIAEFVRCYPGSNFLVEPA